ncbi:hypothetical protein P3H15_27265 [Rhodococcus sp. T2V]|uniref:hypothetical protein n=1 Tax=Rhodococcus sp. T2V TaxID=3034164 RepID=UPI0023E24A30|nr:hypothetical protein [Rhodococcus sp. T2V]MDF3308722.1 hypothetical protein [Rhodococcus sp. T2V]
MPMSNNRLWDDSVFAPPGTPLPPPQFTISLITRLGLARASDAEKAKGIEQWLEWHIPSERLKKSLIKSGYKHLLHLPA